MSTFRDRLGTLRRWFEQHPNVRCPGLDRDDRVPFPEDFVVHVAAEVTHVDGASPTAESECLEAACSVLDILARGRKTFIRVYPTASAVTDFARNTKMATGYVRFSVCPEEGEWVAPGSPPRYVFA